MKKLQLYLMITAVVIFSFGFILLPEGKLEFKTEWKKVENDNNSKLYLPFTHIEFYIPWVFFVIHAFVLLNGLRILDVIMWLVCND